ncbi:hypothetical protein EBY67_08070, partial [bacterium]|nr:hypothetical protein [bacterium]
MDNIQIFGEHDVSLVHEFVKKAPESEKYCIFMFDEVATVGNRSTTSRNLLIFIQHGILVITTGATGGTAKIMKSAACDEGILLVNEKADEILNSKDMIAYMCAFTQCMDTSKTVENTEDLEHKGTIICILSACALIKAMHKGKNTVIAPDIFTFCSPAIHYCSENRPMVQKIIEKMRSLDIELDATIGNSRAFTDPTGKAVYFKDILPILAVTIATFPRRMCTNEQLNEDPINPLTVIQIVQNCISLFTGVEVKRDKSNEFVYSQEHIKILKNGIESISEGMSEDNKAEALDVIIKSFPLVCGLSSNKGGEDVSVVDMIKFVSVNNEKDRLLRDHYAYVKRLTVGIHNTN